MYLIECHDFKRRDGASDEHLQKLTEGVLEIFSEIRSEINSASNQDKSMDKILTINREFAQKKITDLARFGRRAYRRFFDENARKYLGHCLCLIDFVAPTFSSSVLPFPWEVLYEGENYEDADPDQFWGIRYAPARMLDPEKNEYDYPLVQDPPSQMLFCLNHKLTHAKSQEWPKVKKLLDNQPDAEFRLLSSSIWSDANRPMNGEHFLKYLDGAKHNMLHFACHCKQTNVGNDALQISLIENHDFISDNESCIHLETGNFEDVDGQFGRKPLVFLNACQSGPSPDGLRKTYNLPRMFMERGAGAVIATACPVPDAFAAEFARIFYSEFLIPKEKKDTVNGLNKVPRTKMIGEALRDTRRYFIKRYNNPLGLAYGLYSPAFYRLREMAIETEESLV
jgi:hypothetical protein